MNNTVNERPIGFDNDAYLRLQSEHIRERMASFGGKLYLEFGGKLFDDYHAARVLPGFRPDSKMQMLLQMKDETEILIAINANDIEKNKKRGDLGITYDLDTLRLIDAFRDYGLLVRGVVLTRFAGQEAAVHFENRLNSLGVATYRHYPIADYPTNTDLIVSEEGFGKNDFVPTQRPVVVVTAPGPGSGKMAVCLSQLYHHNRRNDPAGYAKFETFPVWNLPLKHPVNLAYEAATADLNDVNMIDPYHLEAYGKTTVNYNRDIEIFPVLETLFRSIGGSCPYKSPTDMGVNMVGNAICDDAVCREASKQEILRRYFHTLVDVRRGDAEPRQVHKLEVLMRFLGLTDQDRPPVPAARKRGEETGGPAFAIELPDGSLVAGRTTDLLGAASGCLINALKRLAGIHDSIYLMSPAVLAPLQNLKVDHLGSRNPRLHPQEVLIALSISALTNPTAQLALDQLEQMRAREGGHLREDLRTHLSRAAELRAEILERAPAVVEEYRMDVRCARTVWDMMQDCRADGGGYPMICSAYRTQEYQQELFDNKVIRVQQERWCSVEEATELAADEVAYPGTSEHQLGLAADIIDETFPYLTEWQETTPTQHWLAEHAAEYGFILRYPAGTSEITGIIYEPWHYRYVGEKFAREITNRGLTLEEYAAWRRGR